MEASSSEQAGVVRAQATLAQTKFEYDCNKLLHDQKIVTDPEFNTAQLNYQLAKADATSAQIALDKARQNLSYTSIYALIDGIVVERDMDVGQAVAASDIGQIKRASQVQAASAVVSARYGLVFQQALMSYYTGGLDPAHVVLNG